MPCLVVCPHHWLAATTELLIDQLYSQLLPTIVYIPSKHIFFQTFMSRQTIAAALGAFQPADAIGKNLLVLGDWYRASWR